MVEDKIELEIDVLCAFLGAGPVASFVFLPFIIARTLQYTFFIE